MDCCALRRVRCGAQRPDAELRTSHAGDVVPASEQRPLQAPRRINSCVVAGPGAPGLRLPIKRRMEFHITTNMSSSPLDNAAFIPVTKGNAIRRQSSRSAGLIRCRTE